MIASLDDAWTWYESVDSLTQVMQRLGIKHWDQLPWEGALGRDSLLRELHAETIAKQSAAVYQDLDDLCILLLFSVFEAIVRAQVMREVAVEVPSLRHPALVDAAATVQENIELGSFFKVLAPFKREDANLVEEVNQVRCYRNWVAHGRRGPQPSALDPRAVRGRLQRFLDRFLRTTEPNALPLPPPTV